MRSSTTLLALVAACAATWWAYATGLHGGFLFDDYVNLPALGATGPVDDLPTFWRYITSGTADPTGRPLSLLSFLIDARDWPADPAPFLRTNLVLHLVNGVLLFALLRLLGKTDRPARDANAPALLGAAAWLLHPLFVSTTLYIVQREAMLAATFVLLGLLAYAHGRLRMSAAWMCAGLVGGTLLAIACKANGILLPLLAWVLEATLFSRDGERRLRGFRITFLVLPSVLLFAWLGTHLLRNANTPLTSRDWTIAQRALTEPRVLLDYLQLLFVPRAMSTGLFNDDYALSTGWLQPWTTLPALLAVIALIAGAIALRKRTPALSAAILFFFAGHLLESSVLALEPYYEHRNYLPAMLAFWPLARALCAWKRPAWQRGAIAFAVLAMFAATTHARTTLWGQPDRLAILWADQNPESPRAQALAAMAHMREGRPDRAQIRLLRAIEQRPQELQLLFNLVDAQCAMGRIDPRVRERVALSLQTARIEHSLAWRWLDGAITRTEVAPCRGIDAAVLRDWIDKASLNPRMQANARKADIASLRGRLALLDKDPVQARAQFDLGLAAWPTPSAAAQQAALLATHGEYALALGHLDRYEALHAQRVRKRGFDMAALHERVLERQGYWDSELRHLRATLRADLERAK